MFETYQAILRANHVEWSGSAPPHLAADTPVRVHITLLEEEVTHAARPTSGERMAAALEQLAKTHSLTGIEDPAAWERSAREDRPLPDRDA
jgi:GTP cyclohydrolase II